MKLSEVLATVNKTNTNSDMCVGGAPNNITAALATSAAVILFLQRVIDKQ